MSEPISHQDPLPSSNSSEATEERLPYEKPAIIFEGKLETHAGYPMRPNIGFPTPGFPK